MGYLRRWINRLLSKGAKPSGPAASTFGAGAKRRMADQARDDKLEFEIERGKSRPTSF